MALVDPFGRALDYLRVSVTDRCNLRCVYCLPAEGLAAAPSREILSEQEILRLGRVAMSLGVRKFRITGGEPLVRPGIVELLRGLSGLGPEDLSLSTNGMLLAGLARDLARAGLRRINISLDTLRPERFKRITRHGSLERVLAGIRSALEAGLSPVKINVVVMRGVNADEIPDFVALARERPLHVRFIELMPIGRTGFFGPERWLPLSEIRALCGALEPLAPGEGPRGCGPASYFRPPRALGSVGFIAALSCNFCRRCNRLRLTAGGRLLPCLASEAGVDLRAPLRSGAQDEELAGLFRQAVAMKPERHGMEVREQAPREAFMCALGG